MDNSTVLTQNITVTAQYTPKTYIITIYPNGASGSNKTYSVSYGTSWSIPSCPFSRSGYNFGGYKTGTSSGTSYSVGGKVTVTGDLSLYCQWTAVQYTVSIRPNGASGSTKTYTVTYGQKWTVPSCPFSRTGYTFSGYSGGYSVGQSITITGNITINCNWTLIPSKFDFQVKGVLTEDVPMLGDHHDSSIYITAYPSKCEGYKLICDSYTPSNPSQLQHSIGEVATFNSSIKNKWLGLPTNMVTSASDTYTLYYGSSTSSKTKLCTVSFANGTKSYSF